MEVCWKSCFSFKDDLAYRTVYIHRFYAGPSFLVEGARTSLGHNLRSLKFREAFGGDCSFRVDIRHQPKYSQANSTSKLYFNDNHN